MDELWFEVTDVDDVNVGVGPATLHLRLGTETGSIALKLPIEQAEHIIRVLRLASDDATRMSQHHGTAIGTLPPGNEMRPQTLRIAQPMHEPGEVWLIAVWTEGRAETLCVPRDAARELGRTLTEIADEDVRPSISH